MNKLDHFLLPENTNQLYKNEAISSIWLTKEVAVKINELVDAYNEVAACNLEKHQELEGYIRKGVIFMKDNLVNSLHDLFKLLYDSGELNDIISDAVLSDLSLVKDRTEGVVNVKQFGAMGDGINDDTEAIQEAIRSGKFIYLPKGTYKIKETLNLEDQCILYGAGSDTVIMCECDPGIITYKAGAVIRDLNLKGNDNNTGLSVYQNRQIIQNVGLENFKTGVINKNSDYIGSVKFLDMYFNNVGTCFNLGTLTNGVAFDRIVAYRFDCILKSHWLEGISFNSCFFELGNEGSLILGIPEGKTSCRSMGVNFNSCYIEKVAQLFTDKHSGMIKFSDCWLFTQGTFYDAEGATNNLKMIFDNTAFSISSAMSNSAVLFKLADVHTAIFKNIYCLKSGSGAFTFTKGKHTTGGTVQVDDKIMIQKTVTGTTTEAGDISLDLDVSKYRIVSVYGYLTDNSANLVCSPFMSGDSWYAACTNSTYGQSMIKKAVSLRVVYVPKENIEV